MNIKLISITICSSLLFLITGFIFSVQAERIKDITSIYGVRDNPLVGYGLVVGLDGTGDSTEFGKRSLRRMLSEFGINVPFEEIDNVKNIAVVALHAILPPFAKPGQKIDVTISSIGKAKSLRGGSLLLTPLKGADGNVYAVAQGSLVVGGFGIDGADGSKVTLNVPVVGRIPNGATVERMPPSPFLKGENIVFYLHRSDFTTVKRLTDTINNFLGPETAFAIDGSSVKVRAPLDSTQRIGFLSVLENLTVTPGDAPARIIVNSRTGTIVIGQHVMVSPAAVSHGNLVVTISEQVNVSQPAPFSEGVTAVVPQSNIQVSQDDSRMFVFDPGVSLEELVRAVNMVGAAPGDLMAILEALKQAGALQAELVVI